MTAISARLAGALYEGLIDGGMLVTNEVEWEDVANHLLDVLLSLDGIAIVHTDDIKYAFSDPHLGYDRHRAAINRLLKAAEQDPR